MYFFASHHHTNIKEANICLNCPQAVWKNSKCLLCPALGKPTADRSACEEHYLATNNIYYACDNASHNPASTEQECDTCGEGVRIWRSVYKDCISCNYSSALISKKG